MPDYFVAEECEIMEAQAAVGALRSKAATDIQKSCLQLSTDLQMPMNFEESSVMDVWPASECISWADQTLRVQEPSYRNA